MSGRGVGAGGSAVQSTFDTREDQRRGTAGRAGLSSERGIGSARDARTVPDREHHSDEKRVAADRVDLYEAVGMFARPFDIEKFSETTCPHVRMAVASLCDSPIITW